jgi:hypothetical protein
MFHIIFLSFFLSYTALSKSSLCPFHSWNFQFQFGVSPVFSEDKELYNELQILTLVINLDMWNVTQWTAGMNVKLPVIAMCWQPIICHNY